LYKEYIDQLVANAVENVGLENNVTVADMQQLHAEQLSKNGIVLRAIVYMKPQVQELDYSNIKLQHHNQTPSQQEVDQVVEGYRNKNALIVPITDRGVQFDDIVNISFEGKIDGIPFPNGSLVKRDLPFTKGGFIQDFEDQVLNMNPGEFKTFEATFPETYNVDYLAGKKTTFDVTIHEIKKRHLPEVDDDFAKTCGFDSVELLRQEISSKLSARKKEEQRSQAETQVCLELLNRAKISPVPTTMIQKRLATMLQQEVSNHKTTEEQYLKQRNIDREQFNKLYEKHAERDLKIQLVLEFVANKQNLEITQDDIEKYLSEESVRLNMPIESLRLIPMIQIEAQLKMRKAYEYLISTAEFV
jgi:trigger factor